MAVRAARVSHSPAHGENFVMTLGLDPEQQDLSDAVGQFAVRYAPIADTRADFGALAAGVLPKWWDALVGSGFHAVHLPERLGGQGGRMIDAACVLESAGKALLPGPLLPTVTTGAVALLADQTPAAESLLHGLVSGLPAAVVFPDDGDLRARAGEHGWLLTGTSAVTAGACSARTILAGARSRDNGIVWAVIDTERPTAAIEPAAGTDLVGDVGILRLTDYAASDVLTGIDADRARCVALGLIAATTAGITQWCVQAVTTHLRTREQFGKAIGTFQALQHNAAMLLVNSELATAAAWDAIRAVDESLDQHQIAAAGAAVIAISPVPDLVLDTLTMFGAVSFTWEHDLHLYWRRAISLAASIGPANRWGRRLGQLTRTGQRDISVDLGDAESEFRMQVAETLDVATAVGPWRRTPAAAHRRRRVRQAARSGTPLAGYRRVGPAPCAPRRIQGSAGKADTADATR
jgi:3-oxochol-4-en-24-oyl-CoA dehydrogenase